MSSSRWFLSRAGLVQCPACNAHVRYARNGTVCSFCATEISADALAAPASRAALGGRGALVAASLFGLSIGASLGCATGQAPADDPAASQDQTKPADGEPSPGEAPPPPADAPDSPPVAEYGMPAEPVPEPMPEPEPPQASPGNPGEGPSAPVASLYGGPPPEPMPGDEPTFMPEYGIPADPQPMPVEPVPVALYGEPPIPQPTPGRLFQANIGAVTTDDGGRLVELTGISTGEMPPVGARSAPLPGSGVVLVLESCAATSCLARIADDAGAELLEGAAVEFVVSD